MSWLPWVSRPAYDTVVEWNQDLRKRLTAVEDHLQRITRKQEGMTEVPREPKEPVEPIPYEIEAIIMRFGGELTRTEMRNHARIAHHRDGVAWSELQHELEQSLV